MTGNAGAKPGFGGNEGRLVMVPRTGPAVHSALEGEMRAAFEEEFSRALERTAEDFDTDRLIQVVGKWHPMALATANPDPAVDVEHQAWKDRGENFAELHPVPESDVRVSPTRTGCPPPT